MPRPRARPCAAASRPLRTSPASRGMKPRGDGPGAADAAIAPARQLRLFATTAVRTPPTRRQLDDAFVDGFSIVRPVETALPRFRRLAALGLDFCRVIPRLARRRARRLVAASMTTLATVIRPAVARRVSRGGTLRRRAPGCAVDLLAAGDVQHFAGDPACGGRGEEDGRVGDLLAAAEARRSECLRTACSICGIVGLLERLGLDRAGRDAVEPHLRSPLDRQASWSSSSTPARAADGVRDARESRARSRR